MYSAVWELDILIVESESVGVMTRATVRLGFSCVLGIRRHVGLFVALSVLGLRTKRVIGSAGILSYTMHCW